MNSSSNRAAGIADLITTLVKTSVSDNTFTMVYHNVPAISKVLKSAFPEKSDESLAQSVKNFEAGINAVKREFDVFRIHEELPKFPMAMHPATYSIGSADQGDVPIPIIFSAIGNTYLATEFDEQIAPSDYMIRYRERLAEHIYETVEITNSDNGYVVVSFEGDHIEDHNMLFEENLKAYKVLTGEDVYELGQRVEVTTPETFGDAKIEDGVADDSLSADELKLVRAGSYYGQPAVTQRSHRHSPYAPAIRIPKWIHYTVLNVLPWSGPSSKLLFPRALTGGNGRIKVKRHPDWRHNILYKLPKTSFTMGPDAAGDDADTTDSLGNTTINPLYHTVDGTSDDIDTVGYAAKGLTVDQDSYDATAEKTVGDQVSDVIQFHTFSGDASTYISYIGYKFLDTITNKFNQYIHFYRHNQYESRVIKSDIKGDNLGYSISGTTWIQGVLFTFLGSSSPDNVTSKKLSYVTPADIPDHAQDLFKKITISCVGAAGETSYSPDLLSKIMPHDQGFNNLSGNHAIVPFGAQISDDGRSSAIMDNSGSNNVNIVIENVNMYHPTVRITNISVNIVILKNGTFSRLSY